ncbi:MAG: phosphoribosylglycinamide synthetase C domain-containing protein, partial [Thermomonas haemolytica]
IDASGAPKVIEFNVRFGDPETQPVLLRLQSDLVELIEAAIDGRLDRVDAQWDVRSALGVVMASRPYPDTPVTGEVISGLDAVPADAKVFHAGTALGDDGAVITAGGRVLCVCALGETVAAAQRAAYAGVAAIRWPHAFHRTDIGYRALARTPRD